MNNQFAENLKRIRKEYNLSQEQLADELKVSRQAISKWESSAAYPEMDKIITLCNKFNLNIDDLLHKDIKEIKGEEESKKKINSIIDDFLKFITDTINLFSNMNFKSKIKCLFEQIIIAFVLYMISGIVFSILTNLFTSIFEFLPNTTETYIKNILESITIILCVAASIIILTHVFKTRYLDYYDKLTKIKTNVEKENEKAENNNNNNDNISFKKDENKIIIRDPKHSEYRFINGLFKLIIIIIKLFALWIALCTGLTLIFLTGTLIASFLICKTGIFFIGTLITIISAIIISIVILLLLLNFVFNRKNNKKGIIWSLIIALIALGIGSGLIFIGTLNFEVSENENIKIETREHEMREDLVLYPYYNYKINYVKSNINNIKIEYTVNKLCTINENNHEKKILSVWTNCENPIKITKEFINNINNKKIVSIDNIEKITIYASETNINKLKKNLDDYYQKENEENEENEEYDAINEYKNKIDELEEENHNLKEKIDVLEEINKE